MTRLLRRAGVAVGRDCSTLLRFKRGEPAGRRNCSASSPLHVVCSWLGNSPRIAQQSFLLVTEDDFGKATGVAKVMVEG
jgi:hypothetical protein